MARKMVSIFMLGLAGYLVFENRYRVMNMLLGNSFLRRVAVGSIMGLPGIRSKMMGSLFSGPSEFQ
ncbi:hypothetical protein J7E38_00745 [Bacillus sp. ISL-35]|uniref:hypothetical protein n=1 Tax=Bacillus sp. ISL-35 TaxID=2819122 RepID=UPI001BEBAC61|nr:hypothetical protein [Bacillus sp. ISL-35]MBT2677504.1 hypothetical protein [Bacillus sp. ISL-35]MBT2702108.1 hypothetical protein [Chryseobacterium sp. ISL-80]